MTNYANDLEHILDKKIHVCEDFLSATLLLKEALETEEMTAVDHLIGRRQELMRVIDDVDRRLGQYRHTDPPHESRQMLMLAEDLKRIFEQIMSANRACEAVASGKCEDTRKELVMVRQREGGLTGYAPQMNRVPKFFNVRT
jgi:hypothetical protein